MAVGRNKCVIKGVNPKKVMPHDEFIERIRKSLYYGAGTTYQDMSVSRPLAEYASELFSEPHRGHSLNRLNKVTAGKIRASPYSLLMALIYLERLNNTDPNYVRQITPSDLFIVSMMVSTKFYCGHDEEIYLSDWAKEGNITEKRIRELELEFLCAIDWNIYISNEEFFNKLQSIERTLAHREGIRRGWLTYTELQNFLPSFTLGKFLLNNIAIMAVSYAASVMTIAGAFFIVSHIPGNALTKGHHVQTDNTNLININNEIGSNTKTIIYDSTNLLDDDKENRTNICPAFDIDEELNEYEMKFNEMPEINMKNNENPGPLINLYGNYIIKNLRSGFDSGVNFQNFMDSDNCHLIGNCTKSILWSLIQSNERNLVKLPFIWLKFIY